MKKTILALATMAAMTYSASAAFNQNITAIFGGGNPDTGWTTDTASGITLALRGKDRETSSTANISGVYSFATGTFPANRARWNWEFSIDSGADNLSDDYDYYVAVDTDPSECIDYTVVDALLFWTDNSYGDDTTANGLGVEGTSGPPNNYASDYNIAQQSQNIVFAGGDPFLDATYNYELFAVAKGDGADGTRIASVGITVVVGTGGLACDTDDDGIFDDDDNCPTSDLSATVVIDGCNTGVPNTLSDEGCTISDLLGQCAAGATSHGQYVSCVAEVTNWLKAQGVITGKQKSVIQNCAAKSSIGN